MAIPRAKRQKSEKLPITRREVEGIKRNLDSHKVHINDLSKSIKASTGIDWGRF